MQTGTYLTWLWSCLIIGLGCVLLHHGLPAHAAQSAQAPPIATGIAVGQKIPPFRLVDQFGKAQDFNSIRGPKGAALFFNRSADW